MRASWRRRFQRALLSILLLLCPIQPNAAEPAVFEFGILPALSTRVIFDTYEPMRMYLQEQLRRPVVLVTAPDYRTYIERTQRGEYSFLVTAPHFARLAQTEAGYVPIARVQRELRSIIVARADGGIRRLGDLRGKQVTTPESLAIVSMLGKQLLRRHGLEPGKDLAIQPQASFNSAVLAVQNGEADAAVTAPTALAQMPEETRSIMRVIGTSDPVPHVIYIANRRMPAAEVEQIRRALLRFSDDKKYGSAFFQKTGFGGLVRPTPGELRSLDPYVAELKRQLKTP